MAVSVVIPAFDAEATLGAALDSLAAQTYDEWEAIVVDDGSRDGTLDLARARASRDPRVRVVEHGHEGAGAARNAGIEAASHPHLLFLDADDTLLPGALEVLVEALEQDPEAVAAYGSWARVGADGRQVTLTPASGRDLFPLFARYCVFAIHSCVVRTSAVLEAGLFDSELRICEDWDLWQRIARTGGRFVHVPEVVALYHFDERSLSRDLRRFLADGLVVSARGHAPDPRVARPHPDHAAGAPAERLADAQVLLASWIAGVALGEGSDATDLLEGLPSGPIANLDPERIGMTLFETAFRLRCLDDEEALESWPRAEAAIAGFLDALEQRSGRPGLGLQARRALERRLLAEYPRPRPVTVGGFHAVRQDLTEPIRDVECPTGADRAVVSLVVGDDELGVVELPAIEGRVDGDVVADLDDERAWRLLGLFFTRTVYPELDVREEDDGLVVRRGDVVLARGLAREQASLPALHDHVGWTAFLQELWGLPDRDGDSFYSPGEEPVGAAREVSGAVVLDVTDTIEALATDDDELVVELRVGGGVVGHVVIPSTEGIVSEGALRTALTTEAGFELCRLAVREALVGRALDGPDLRERLREAGPRGRETPEGPRLGRHPGAPPGTSASRRVELPPSALDDVRALVAVTGQPLVDAAENRPIVYDPGLLGLVSAARRESHAAEASIATVAAYGRHHFEELLASEQDPWRYESAYERRKYEQTLSLVPAGAKRVLEIGCAEGHFTVGLAARVGELVAADISEIALARARERCAGLLNVDFVQLDVASDPLPGRFDVILCSELLYYVQPGRLPAVARKLADALVPGGVLVLAHANLQADDPDEPGFDWAMPHGARRIGDVLAAEGTLRLAQELRTPFYRVQRFERKRGRERVWAGRAVPVIEDVPHEEPIPEVLDTFRWEPATVESASTRAETWHLPILMYHRVAYDGPEATARWRVAPDEFERQVAYLADAGFRTVGLEEWRRAGRLRRPLPGRAVVLTFDDAYEDFATHAWPVLERHGLGALVFLVSGHVGHTAAWDSDYGSPAPLLDWDTARDLADRGVEFGSHCLSHAPLTRLSVDELTHELLRSRVAIETELDRSVDAIAYPHGSYDPVVEHLAGACGYVFGLTCVPGPARFGDRPLALPRQEISGSTSFAAFVSALRG